MSEKYVLQKDKYDCGIASLKTIFSHYGKSIKINDAKINSCISAYELIKLSKSNGMNAKGVKADLSCITANYLPCISHIIKDNSYFHYIVILKNNYKQKNLIVFDPSEGIKKISYEEYQNMTTNIYIIFQNKKIEKESDKRFYTILIFLFKQYKLYIICSIIMSLFYIILSLIFSSYSKIILTFNDYFINISVIFLLLSFLKNSFLFFKNRLIIKINEKTDGYINNVLISHLFKLPYNYYQTKSTGYLISTINDIENFKNIIVKIFIMLFVDLLCIFIFIISALFINWYYFFMMFVLFALKIIFSYFYSSKYNNKFINFKQCKISCSSKFINILENISSVKNLFLEEKTSNIIKENEKKLLIEKENFNKINNLYIFINIILEDLWFILIVALSFFIDIDFFSLDNLIVFINIYQLFLTFLNNICNFVIMHKTYISSVQNILDIMDEQEETLAQNLNFNKNKINKIEYYNVSKYFCEKMLFKNISFIVNKNDYIFLEGTSGIGKTTLINLLFQNDKNFTGKILINNINKNNLKSNFIRNNIVYVSNKDNLFIDTILNNLKIVNKNDKEIDKVILVCGLEKLLIKRNSNYIIDNTLSSGEKSRILIARALLTNAKIIIFDECFNEIDLKTERKILEKIKKNYDVTLILISHRKNNIDLFNKHYKLQNNTLKIVKEE